MLSRRSVLQGLFGCGVTAAMPELTLARAATDNRLAVIVLRGAMDGLEAVQPYGDAAFRQLRGDNAIDPATGLIDLDGRFGVRRELAPLADLYARGELSFVHAVSTPYRSRSHFEGQDMLESGAADQPRRDGWLNRLLPLLPEADATALDVADLPSLILKGDSPVRSWRPNTRVDALEENTLWLRRLYEADPLFHAAFEAALSEGMARAADEAAELAGYRAIADLAGRALASDSRIAVFTVPAWDTHANQAQAVARPLQMLAASIETLRERLGPLWGRTAVVAVSEFGRTVRINGNRGTDHGTGGAMVLAGGLLAGGQGGRVLGRWPGLGEGDLLDDRDLMPTDDVRRYLGWLLRDLYALPAATIADAIFPGLDLGSDLRLVG